ncbi:hypothetical protein D3C80_1126810 [compost metagenome]
MRRTLGSTMRRASCCGLSSTAGQLPMVAARPLRTRLLTPWAVCCSYCTLSSSPASSAACSTRRRRCELARGAITRVWLKALARVMLSSVQLGACTLNQYSSSVKIGSACTCSSSSAFGTRPKSTLPSSIASPPSWLRPSRTVSSIPGNFSLARVMISGNSKAEAVTGMAIATRPLGLPLVDSSSSLTVSMVCTTERAISYRRRPASVRLTPSCTRSNSCISSSLSSRLIWRLSAGWAM